jgi:hypothetical protein
MVSVLPSLDELSDLLLELVSSADGHKKVPLRYRSGDDQLYGRGELSVNL